MKVFRPAAGSISLGCREFNLCLFLVPDSCVFLCAFFSFLKYLLTCVVLPLSFSWSSLLVFASVWVCVCVWHARCPTIGCNIAPQKHQKCQGSVGFPGGPCRKHSRNPKTQDESGFSRRVGFFEEDVFDNFLLLQRKPGEESKEILGGGQGKWEESQQGNPRKS